MSGVIVETNAKKSNALKMVKNHDDKNRPAEGKSEEEDEKEAEIPVFWTSAVRINNPWRVFAKMMTDFLVQYVHLVVYKHGDLPESAFSFALYPKSRLFLKSCTIPHIFEYIELLRDSLMRWIMHKRLTDFHLVLANSNGTKLKQFDVRVFFKNSDYENAVFMRSRFEKSVHEVNLKLGPKLVCILSELQSSSASRRKKSTTIGPLRLTAYCSLVDGTTHMNRNTEHCWLHAEALPPWKNDFVGVSNNCDQDVNLDIVELKIFDYFWL